MRPFAIAAMMIVLVSAPAFAQLTQGQQAGPRTTRSDADKRMDADVDQEYQKALKHTGGAPAAPKDPWGNVRPANTTPDKR